MCQLLIPNSQSVSEALLWGINWPGKGEEEKQIKDGIQDLTLLSGNKCSCPWGSLTLVKSVAFSIMSCELGKRICQ